MFIELFCTERGCDCRNVMIYVYHVETKQQVASLRYCWKSKSYYDKIRLDFREEVPGVFIDMGTSGSYNKFFRKTLEELCFGNADPNNETEYAQRLKRHYQQFREKLRESNLYDDEKLMIPQPYSPCPCASGKKI
jgi:hypothetical protein